MDKLNAFLDTIFTIDQATGTIGNVFTLQNFLTIVLMGFVCGLIISYGYILSNRKDGGFTADMMITLLMLPVLVSLIMFFVGNQVARAFSIAGIFTIVRFRSIQTKPKDITYIFFTVVSGLINGLGYIWYALGIAIVLTTLIFLIKLVKYGTPKTESVNLKITVPEALNFDNAFEEILDKYTVNYRLMRIKSTDYGSLFVLNYFCILKSTADRKKLIDELRTRNGNMDIAMSATDFENE